MTSRSIMAAAILTFAVAFAPAPAYADKLDDLERKIDVLTDEMERLKLGQASEPDLKSISGFAPAASKVYQKGEKQVSLGGYGEMKYENWAARKQNGDTSGKVNKVDFLRAILYVGYKFNDWITFNSEYEFEHANSGANGEVGVEMAALDLKPWDFLGFRAGLLLVPVGLTNEFHEPTTYHGVNRPSIASKIIPTTWRANGAGFFGKIGPVQYRTYLVAGLQAASNGSFSGFSASSGLRGGRTKGSKSRAVDWAWVTRIDVSPVEGTLIGGSIYSGDTGQGLVPGSTRVTIWDVHGKIDWQGLEAKALYSRTRIKNVTNLNAVQGLTGNASIGERMFGGYLEVAYDVLRFMPNNKGHKLSPFFRYERYDTQHKVPAGFTVNPANSRVEYTTGLSYKPMSQVVLKVDHQIMRNQARTGVNQTNLGFGYIF